MKKGYITLSRKFFDSPVWQEPRSYSRSEAWIDLIQSARFEDGTVIIKGGRVLCINRGELHASLRYLSERWGRSVKWVRVFIAFLEKEGTLKQRRAQGETILTLCNYDTYNRQKIPSSTPSST